MFPGGWKKSYFLIQILVFMWVVISNIFPVKSVMFWYLIQLSWRLEKQDFFLTARNKAKFDDSEKYSTYLKKNRF